MAKANLPDGDLDKLGPLQLLRLRFVLRAGLWAGQRMKDFDFLTGPLGSGPSD